MKPIQQTKDQAKISQWSTIILSMDGAESQQRHDRLKEQGLLFPKPTLFPLGSKVVFERGNCAVPDLIFAGTDNLQSVVVPSFSSLEIVGTEMVGGEIVNKKWHEYERIYHVLADGKIYKMSEIFTSNYFAKSDYEPPVTFSIGCPVEFELCDNLYKMKVGYSGKASEIPNNSLLWSQAASRHEHYERLYVLIMNAIPMLVLGDVEMQRIVAKTCTAKVVEIAGGRMALLKFCQETFSILLTDTAGEPISNAHGRLLKAGECE